jgi:hypothetical protein
LYGLRQLRSTMREWYQYRTQFGGAEIPLRLESLTRIIHEASTARVDQADLTGVLGLRTLRRGVEPRLGSKALREPVISACCTRSLRTFMNNAG